MKGLGFTDYEARVYLALLAKSPATAYEVSNGSGVPRPNTYSALNALTTRKAIMPVSTNPVRYVPQPPTCCSGQLLPRLASYARAWQTGCRR